VNNASGGNPSIYYVDVVVDIIRIGKKRFDIPARAYNDRLANVRIYRVM
jgi:hypothetical protein